ncbi:MAG: DUF1501 domain-containing protein [Terracidiphilus sp.]
MVWARTIRICLAWLLYGLGTDNQNLPGYITINPPIAFGGASNYGSAFLPAYYQGTAITDQGFMPNIKAATEKDLERQQIDLIHCSTFQRSHSMCLMRMASSPDRKAPLPANA